MFARTIRLAVTRKRERDQTRVQTSYAVFTFAGTDDCATTIKELARTARLSVLVVSLRVSSFRHRALMSAVEVEEDNRTIYFSAKNSYDKPTIAFVRKCLGGDRSRTHAHAGRGVAFRRTNGARGMLKMRGRRKKIGRG